MGETTKFALGRLDFDARAGELRTRGETRRLEPKAAAVLQILCERSGAVVSRLDLLDRCWGDGEGSDEALTQAVAQIRRALDELGESGLVETLAKRGYRLNVTPAADIAVGEPHPSRMKRAIVPLLAITAGLVLILLLANPHGPRHFVRHTLGLGPATTR